MEYQNRTIRVDYHFHPNLPRNEARAQEKVTALYDRLKDKGIGAVIITEHVYKNPQRAWHMMVAHRPEGIQVFPGLEYVTAENIDICLFSETDSIYQYHWKPFELSYREVLAFLKEHPDVYGFVTHPFTLGRTSVVDSLGEDFTKEAIQELGSVEVAYTVFDDLKRILEHSFLLPFSRNVIQRIEKNQSLPSEYLPQKVRFFAAGSDAHHVWEIGTYVEVSLKGEGVFHSIVHNTALAVFPERETTVVQLILSGFTTLHEAFLKKWYHIWHK